MEGVQKIKPGYNPAAWMLEVSSMAEEARLDIDFAEVYKNSRLFQYVQLLISCNSSSLVYDTLV